MRHILPFCFLLIPFLTSAQKYTAAQVFAHNDYARERPFYAAYELGVGYIEADVFLEDNQLMVAHHKNEISEGRTLEALYLKPMDEMAKMNRGFAYRDPARRLTIMIDLKTEGTLTLNAVVSELKNYPRLIQCPTLQIMISGSVPDPEKWKDYPDYIFFDGRPSISYTEEQLRRVSMISASFGQHVHWDGHGKLAGSDRRKIRALLTDVHSKDKPFRFWGTPDFPEAWRTLLDLNMDVIVTDDVQALVEFFATE